MIKAMNNKDIMKISCVQMDMRPQNLDERFELAKAHIRNAAENGSDTIVLPETWSTGFFPEENLEQYCDDNGERIKREIGGLAKELSVNIVAGSVANKKDGGIYNTAFVFDRQGNMICEYDKTHLFSPMGEDKFFQKGKKICKFTLDSKKCGIIICYDIRFPELTRTLALSGLDMLFVVAQWPIERVEHLSTLVRARAIENQTFCVCCNACGSFSGSVFGGSSRIVDMWGNELAAAGESEQIITAECDFSKLSPIREGINIFNDRRTDLYDLKQLHINICKENK